MTTTRSGSKLLLTTDAESIVIRQATTDLARQSSEALWKKYAEVLSAAAECKNEVEIEAYKKRTKETYRAYYKAYVDERGTQAAPREHDSEGAWLNSNSSHLTPSPQ